MYTRTNIELSSALLDLIGMKKGRCEIGRFDKEEHHPYPKGREWKDVRRKRVRETERRRENGGPEGNPTPNRRRRHRKARRRPFIIGSWLRHGVHPRVHKLERNQTKIIIIIFLALHASKNLFSKSISQQC